MRQDRHVPFGTFELKVENSTLKEKEAERLYQLERLLNLMDCKALLNGVLSGVLKMDVINGRNLTCNEYIMLPIYVVPIDIEMIVTKFHIKAEPNISVEKRIESKMNCCNQVSHTDKISNLQLFNISSNSPSCFLLHRLRALK